MTKTKRTKPATATDQAKQSTESVGRSEREQSPGEIKPVALAALQRVAEELGRLAARSTNKRRGYSLPELMIGVLVSALLLLLIVRLLGG